MSLLLLTMTQQAHLAHAWQAWEQEVDQLLRNAGLEARVEELQVVTN